MISRRASSWDGRWSSSAAVASLKYEEVRSSAPPPPPPFLLLPLLLLPSGVAWACWRWSTSCARSDARSGASQTGHNALASSGAFEISAQIRASTADGAWRSLA